MAIAQARAEIAVPKCTEALLVDVDRRVLLMEERIQGGVFRFPGGAVQQGETVNDAVVRAVRSESGLDIARIALTQCLYYDGIICAAPRENEIHRTAQHLSLFLVLLGSMAGLTLRGSIAQDAAKPRWLELDVAQDLIVQSNPQDSIVALRMQMLEVAAATEERPSLID